MSLSALVAQPFPPLWFSERRKLLRVDLLVIDDFALQPLDAADTADVYELIVERRCSTTSTPRAGSSSTWTESSPGRHVAPSGAPPPRCSRPQQPFLRRCYGKAKFPDIDFEGG